MKYRVLALAGGIGLLMGLASALLSGIGPIG